MDNKINTLSGNWSLYYEENSKCANFAYDISSIDDLNKQGFKNLNCTVPGNFVLDLFKNGLIPDPFWGDNAIKLQYLETMHVWYSSKFEINTVDSYLFFGGLDTICDIYIDGKFVLHADNMFTPFKTPVLEMGKHEIVIHFIPPVIEAKKHTIPAASNALWYNYQSMYIRKSAHSFGWDILPRIISCGVWKPIDIMQKKQDSINDVFVYTLYTKPTEKIAKIRMFFDVTTSDDLIQNYRIRFSGNCGDSSFCDEMTIWGNQYSRMAFEIKNAKLWWPRGYGEQNLYQCKAELIKDGTVLDTYNITIGLRTIELDRTDSVKDSFGQFLFKINGEPIFW
ncbi:MAG: hypothetical protein MJ236_02865, partial [Clostridia bacterium]|nr:hypothetical protein [Clostridia bacterium]